MIICFGALFLILLIIFVLLKAWILGEEGVRKSKRKAWIKTLDGFSLSQLETELEYLKKDAERSGIYPGIPKDDMAIQIQRVREDEKRIELVETLISDRRRKQVN